MLTAEHSTHPPRYTLADELARRREAAARCEPLVCGHRDPWLCRHHPPDAAAADALTADTSVTPCQGACGRFGVPDREAAGRAGLCCLVYAGQVPA